MKKIIYLLPVFVLTGVVFGYVVEEQGLFNFGKKEEKQAIITRDTTFDEYSFKALKNREFDSSEIKIGNLVKENDNFSSYVFYFNVSDGSNDNVKKVSGVMSVPKKGGTYPVLVMFRGYVDREKYVIGEGTRHSAEVFSSNGFITFAPDFLGYGESDMPSEKPLEERFETYTTALSLLASIKNLNKAFNNINCHAEFISTSIQQDKNSKILKQVQDDGKGCIKANTEKIGIWGHSNGGHIAIVSLELTGKDYPTVLWAPVSKPFPYSILYYTDEFEDNGRALRKLVAEFEVDYDSDEYSPSNFFEWINAPLQIHQGEDDEAVPQKWSDEFVKKLEGLGKEVTYFTYPGENHNFNNGSWPTAIERSIEFYKNYFF